MAASFPLPASAAVRPMTVIVWILPLGAAVVLSRTLPRWARLLGGLWNGSGHRLLMTPRES